MYATAGVTDNQKSSAVTWLLAESYLDLANGLRENPIYLSYLPHLICHYAVRDENIVSFGH